MGCGHSNRTTADSKSDSQSKEHYMKVKAMREKVLKECEDDDFKPEKQEYYDKLCASVIAKMKGKGEYTDADLIECCYQICSAKHFDTIDTVQNFSEHGDILVEIGAEYSKEDKETAKKIFLREIGATCDVALIEVKERNMFFTRGLFNLLRYGELKGKTDFNTLALVIDEEQMYCEKTMIALKYMIVELKKLKNLTIAIDNMKKKDYSGQFFISKIFQGVELASNIENLTVMRLSQKPIEFKADELEVLVDSVSNFKLKSLALVNLNFIKTSRKVFIQNICNNDNLTMLGLQFDMDEEEFKTIIPLLKGMSKLKLLLFGFPKCHGKDKNFRDDIKKNIPSLELFQVQYFDK